MPINPTTLKAQIDSEITNETVDFAITPAEVGGRMKDCVDYTTEQILKKEIVGLLSYDGTDFTYTSILNQTATTISWLRLGGVIYGTMSSSILTDKTVIEDRNLTVDGGFLIQSRRVSVTSFELAFASTAGLTSSVPNFSNLPIKIEIYN